MSHKVEVTGNGINTLANVDRFRKNQATPPNWEFNPDKNYMIKRLINAALHYLEETKYFALCYESLLQNLQDVDKSSPKTIVCFALGPFAKWTHCEDSNPWYQLGFLILLQKELNAAVEIFDPVFTPEEVKFLTEELGFTVLQENEEGKHVAQELTLFYLPFCNHDLLNNLLYANWSPERLRNCILISNNFDRILRFNLPRQYMKQLSFINRARQVSVGHKVVNGFQCLFEDYFDATIYTFPNAKLNMVTECFWLERKCPVYPELYTVFDEDDDYTLLWKPPFFVDIVGHFCLGWFSRLFQKCKNLSWSFFSRFCAPKTQQQREEIMIYLQV